MNIILFEGKKTASLKEKKLKNKIERLSKKGIVPKLVSIQIGESKGSSLYLSLKQKAAKRIGAVLEVKKIPESTSEEEVIKFIKKLNKDRKVHGVMIQLPLPKSFLKKQDRIIKTISPEKDVDGMLIDGPFLTPTVKAVILAIEDANRILGLSGNGKKVVVGSKGFVGKRIAKALRNASEVDIDTDNKEKIREAKTVISAVGRPGLIKAEMIDRGAVVIDVGAPKGDVDFEEVNKKASYITPVPGGIGPVTIACLMENLIEAASR